ncbi:PREDICTED: SCAN domain-containing protein 1 [Chrysochloris asiatica]|uniref:SCAN domain-containing protein 1 n=1 Tax=Chrysochloris asiatica TaxID=185453 RepID=A0A9B0UBB3_CHRAS|nr:PREDICTED: SCAN domain-containing protein 1 [Chrysochloris asiatica]
MAAIEESLATAGALGSPTAPPEKQSEAHPSSDRASNSAGFSSIPEASPSAPESSRPIAAVPEVPPPPVVASAALELPLGPTPPGPAPLADAAPHSTAGPGCSRPGPETFRQRFRQFRYQDAAGPREAFRQLRELSRQWLRPDVRTKEQIVEMLVQEQLLAILPEAARARRRGRRTDVRITG